jgi:ferric-dicitrate binding protein FerR (iron transport regulator)
LDSAANGMLATQGASQVIKQDNGQLAYTSDKQAHTAALLYNTLSTPRGGQYRLTLPDGTGVWLNAASSITYPTAFAAHERKVSVTGEAYFEVAKDKSKPFHVQVNDMEVTVLGTYFNINAYTDEADIKTTLLEGSVNISKGGDTKLLRPGQQAQAGNAAAIRVVDDVNTSQVVAWKNGLFDFKDADLKAVMRQLERWYDIEVEYKGAVSGYAFRGKLQRSLNLTQVLHILDEMEVKYTLQGRVLTVKP